MRIENMTKTTAYKYLVKNLTTTKTKVSNH